MFGSRRRKTPVEIAVGAQMDKDERFVFKNTALYLHRHFSRYPSYDRETLTILCWVLGKKRETLGDFLLKKMPPMHREHFEEELGISRFDSEDFPDVLAQMIKRTRGRILKRVESLAMDLLKERIEELTHRGISGIEKNVMAVKDLFNLTDHEVEFCVFLFILTTHEIAESYFVRHLGCNGFSGVKFLLNILEMNPRELEDVLGGTLGKIDLYEMDHVDLRIRGDFLKLFMNPSSDNVLKNFFTPIPAGDIPLEWHFGMEKETELLLRLLQEKPRTSTHVMLYGLPGTGKSSYARGLAAHVEAPVYEIARDRENKTANRRAAILACINMTNAGQGSLIIVDEADNILNTSGAWFERGETQDKGWLNQMLETPELRMIWITNRIDCIDDSVLRRFSYSLRFSPFSRRQRIALWGNVLRQNQAKRHFRSADMVNFATRYDVSAGAIDLAVKKAVEMNPGSAKDFRSAVELALRAHQTLLNDGKELRNRESTERSYSLNGLNVKGDLTAMIGQLERFDEALRHRDRNDAINMNLLFYGPPGSGKSELARYLAEHLDREILCKRASDLLNPFVGMSEKKVAGAFSEAETKEAVLVIDEADSMLFGRDRAVHSWEISLTNEFLTQMERYRGILICTTNRLDDLDEASLRRFSYKIGFCNLSPEGNLIFYEKMLAPLIGPPLSQELRSTLSGLLNLAPGDFRTVRSRFAFYPRKSLNHNLLVETLKEESEFKRLHKNDKPVGF